MYQYNPLLNLTEGIIGREIDSLTKPSALGKIARRLSRDELAHDIHQARKYQDRFFGGKISNIRHHLNHDISKGKHNIVKSALFKTKHPIYGGIVVPLGKTVKLASQFTPLPIP